MRRLPITALINVTQIVLVPTAWFTLLLLLRWLTGAETTIGSAFVIGFILWQIALFYSVVLPGIDRSMDDDKERQYALTIGVVVVVLGLFAVLLGTNSGCWRVLGAIAIAVENCIPLISLLAEKFPNQRLLTLVYGSFLPSWAIFVRGIAELFGWV